MVILEANKPLQPVRYFCQRYRTSPSRVTGTNWWGFVVTMQQRHRSAPPRSFAGVLLCYHAACFRLTCFLHRAEQRRASVRLALKGCPQWSQIISAARGASFSSDPINGTPNPSEAITASPPSMIWGLSAYRVRCSGVLPSLMVQPAMACRDR